VIPLFHLQIPRQVKMRHHKIKNATIRRVTKTSG
jgi:hypothetical protein